VQIKILGPLEVCDDAGAPVDVAGARLQELLGAEAFAARYAEGVALDRDAATGVLAPD
jgi:hypothetical protein